MIVAATLDNKDRGNDHAVQTEMAGK